jgi:hypothetical protein
MLPTIFITLTLILSGAFAFSWVPVADASSTRLITSWTVKKMSTDLHRYATRGECLFVEEPRGNHPDLTDEEFYDANCQIWEELIIDDPYGKLENRIRLTLTITARNLPAGWQNCASYPLDFADDVWESIGSFNENHPQSNIYLRTEESEEAAGIGVITGQVSRPSGSIEIDMREYIVDPANSSRLVYYPHMYICGPDSSTASGYSWRLLEGKPISLPSLNKW